MTLDADRLNEFVKSIKNFAQTPMTNSETNTKKKIVEPLLEILGWNLLSNEIRLEYPLKIGSKTEYADYAMVLEDKPVLFLEAKAFDVTLSDEHTAQVISYGKVEDVRWIALTNGRILKILDSKEGRTEKECLVVEINLENLPQQAEELNLISRKSILTGEIENTAKYLAATKKAINVLKGRLQELEKEFKKAIIKITGPEVEKRAENISSQLAKQTIQLFEGRAKIGPSLPDKEVPTIARKELASKAPGEVILCPSRLEGVDFLKKYNAWGFVNVSESRALKYFALYVGKPESSVLYFGEIDFITQPLRSREEIPAIQDEDLETFQTGKRVIHLKPGTLVKFRDPIPIKNKKYALKGRQYTSLDKLAKANHIGEL